MAPWEQDYFVSTAVQAAEMGNQDAVTFLKWESNFIVGRFLNAANGFNPDDGIAYNLVVSDSSGAPLQTWAAIEQATEAAGLSNANTWAVSSGDYGQLAVQSLAGIITVTESTAAIQAYGWLLASAAPYVNAIAGTQFDIVPRLSDGQLLTANHVVISTDTTATVLQGSNNDQLIEAGSGNDTIYGGSGINILFAGSGNDVLYGGSNNDYLFAGSGADTLSGGAGNNFMQAGTGADMFDLSTSDVAVDIIADFKLGTDHLVVAGDGPSSAFVGSLLKTVVQDSSGNAVLHLSSSHSVTLLGIGESQVTTSIFG
jgi:Ca2+-binding RTX toxin-like protein